MMECGRCVRVRRAGVRVVGGAVGGVYGRCVWQKGHVFILCSGKRKGRFCPFFGEHVTIRMFV